MAYRGPSFNQSHLFESYPDRFLTPAQRVLDRLSEALDPELELTLFIVAIDSRGWDNGKVTTKPEGLPDLTALAQNVRVLDHDGEDAGSVVDVSVKNLAHSTTVFKVRDARDDLQSLLTASGKTEGFRYLVSNWTPVLDLAIALVVRMHRGAYQGQATVRVDGEAVRLCDAVIDEFLQGCALAVSQVTDKELERLPLELPDSYLRRGGTSILRRISLVLSDNSQLDLFGILTEISSLPYEGQFSTGGLALVRSGATPRLEIRFNPPIGIDRVRTARKLAQVASEGHWLVSDGERIIGVCTKQSIDRAKTPTFRVRFLSQHMWELSSGSTSAMRVSYGVPHVVRSNDADAKVADALNRVFTSVEQSVVSDIQALVQEAVQCGHGSLLVVVDGAEQEARRLQGQCFPIESVRLPNGLFSAAAKIDGAVLLDVDGGCRAIGVILDGVSEEEGRSERGSRFNSAKRYVEWKNRAVAVVVSDDGWVDVLPE